MANRIQPHPNPPYLKADGTLNALGQLKLYEAGTTTPKEAYKDASGTSYGSTIDLDSAGLPDEGPIYWDNDNLYKVEIYTRVDSTPTYALDYTVDSFGAASTVLVDSLISTATAWTVDGLGATSITFASLADAMDEARNYFFSGEGALTITVNNGTYTNEDVDFLHNQGKNIHIVGESEAGVIYKRTDAQDYVFKLDGALLGSLSTMTIDNRSTASLSYCLILDAGAALYGLDAITMDCTNATSASKYGLRVRSSEVYPGTISINGCSSQAVLMENGIYNTNVDPLSGSGVAPLIIRTSGGIGCYRNSYLYTEIDMDGTAGAVGVSVSNRSYAYLPHSSILNVSVGLLTVYGGMTEAPSIVMTGTSTPYSPLQQTVTTTAGSADISIHN